MKLLRAAVLLLVVLAPASLQAELLTYTLGDIGNFDGVNGHVNIIALNGHHYPTLDDYRVDFSIDKTISLFNGAGKTIFTGKFRSGNEGLDSLQFNDLLVYNSAFGLIPDGSLNIDFMGQSLVSGGTLAFVINSVQVPEPSSLSLSLGFMTLLGVCVRLKTPNVRRFLLAPLDASTAVSAPR